jgi:hypothetical protein
MHFISLYLFTRNAARFFAPRDTHGYNHLFVVPAGIEGGAG